jgi:hypothetical protein
MTVDARIGWEWLSIRDGLLRVGSLDMVAYFGVTASIKLAARVASPNRQFLKDGVGRPLPFVEVLAFTSTTEALNTWEIHIAKPSIV